MNINTTRAVREASNAAKEAERVLDRAAMLAFEASGLYVAQRQQWHASPYGKALWDALKALEAIAGWDSGSEMREAQEQYMKEITEEVKA